MSIENFNQKLSLIRKVKNEETKENSKRRLNNNNVVLKHKELYSSFSRAIDIILSHILRAVLQILKHQGEEVYYR